MPSLGNVPRPAYVYDTETDTWVPIGVGAHTHDDLYVNQNVIDAKGDLLVGTADNAYSRLPVGGNDLILSANSGTSTGLNYTGGWTTWTPTYSSMTLGNGTTTARYQQIGKTVFIWLRIVFGSTTTLGASFSAFSLPKTPSNDFWINATGYLDSGTAWYPGACQFSTQGLGYLKTRDLANIGPTNPFTFGVNDEIVLTGYYEVA